MPTMSNEMKEFWSVEKRQRYENVMSLLIRQIEKIDNEIYHRTGNHIVRYKEQRLKTEQSIKEKMKRKHKNIGELDIEKVINDLAGVRVICFDTRQVYVLVNELKEKSDFDLIKEKDYISHPKENGYQSYHMILEFLEIKVELQIRTILMDAWSSLDTILIYKKTNNPPKDVIDKIQKFSKWSRKIDHMVEEILEEKGKDK